MDRSIEAYKELIEVSEFGKIYYDVPEHINMKKEKILEKHNYSITPPVNSKSRWQTYVQDEKGGRKKVVAQTEDELFLKLQEFYFDDHKITLASLYPIWEERRHHSNVSDRTIRRNHNHWNKYYIGAEIVNQNITKISFLDIEDFLHRCIKEFDMTLKELNNMKFIMKDILKMALRMRIISTNPWNDVEVNTGGCKPQKNRSSAERTFSDDETKRLFDLMNEEVQLKPEVTDFYAIQLLYLLGLRIGEVVTLKFNDINWHTREIHIHRTETMAVDEHGKHSVIVVDHTKKKSKSGDRFLPLSNREISLFSTIKMINDENGYDQEDFIFCDAEARMTIRQLASRLDRLCAKAGIENKSSHDIRRTVASQLHLNNVPIKIIKNFLGHSSEAQTWEYIYDKNEKEDTAKMINKSLDIFSVLKCTQNQEDIENAETRS